MTQDKVRDHNTMANFWTLILSFLTVTGLLEYSQERRFYLEIDRSIDSFIEKIILQPTKAELHDYLQNPKFKIYNHVKSIKMYS